MAYTDAQAKAYYNTLTPEQKAAVDASGGPSLAWLTNAINAGAPDAVKAVGGYGNVAGSKSAEEGGGNYADFSGAASSSEWLGKRKPTAQEVRKWAKETNRSEDYNRFSDAALSGWIERNWDVGAGSFKNNYGDLVDKPDERGANTPANMNGTGDAFGAGGGGGGGGYGGGGGGYGGGANYAASGSSISPGTAGAVPQFNYTPFQAPTYESAISDPGYQFALKEGADQLQHSAAARGVLRTSGTLKDLMNYGQQAAAQQYQNVFNRDLQAWGANYQGQKDQFAPQYGAWQTQYGGDLSKWSTQYGGDLTKWQTQYGGDLSRWTTGQNIGNAQYLNRENNIYGLLNQPAPTY